MTTRSRMTWPCLPSLAWCLVPALTLQFPSYGTLNFLAMRHYFQCLDFPHLCAFAHSIAFSLVCQSLSSLPFKIISKCSVATWFPNKSFSANSVLYKVDFFALILWRTYSCTCLLFHVHYYMWLISSLLSGCSVKYTVQCAVDTAINRIDHVPGLMGFVLKNVCWTEMKSQDSLNVRFKFYALTRFSLC